ncbi:hypothetical protein COE58_26135 [Bacillus cereus]|nr:hypothetical protein COE58_26135 [Bacillus cereus]
MEEHVKVSVYIELSGDEIDHYHKYREYIQLLKDLGLNSYRFSIEWGNLIPFAYTINELNISLNIRGMLSDGKLALHEGVDQSIWETPIWRQEAARIFGIEDGKGYTGFFMASSLEQTEILKAIHQQGRAAIKKASPHTKVDVTFALPNVQSLSGGEEVANRVWHTYFRQFLQMIDGDDFFGLQNYTCEQYGAGGRIIPS